MAMLNLRRRRSFRLRRIWRLSFRERASGMWSSRVRRPTGISKKYNVREYKVQALQRAGLATHAPHLRKRTLATGGSAGLGSCFCAAELLHVEGFEDVADFYVVEIGYAYAAFKAGADFARVILEAL